VRRRRRRSQISSLLAVCCGEDAEEHQNALVLSFEGYITTNLIRLSTRQQRKVWFLETPLDLLLEQMRVFTLRHVLPLARICRCVRRGRCAECSIRRAGGGEGCGIERQDDEEDDGEDEEVQSRFEAYGRTEELAWREGKRG
jgi:hypothetical protein